MAKLFQPVVETSAAKQDRLSPDTLCFPVELYWRPRQESNLHPRFRKPLFYPLNYGDC
jgi:hypothetical protein